HSSVDVAGSRTPWSTISTTSSVRTPQAWLSSPSVNVTCSSRTMPRRPVNVRSAIGSHSEFCARVHAVAALQGFIELPCLFIARRRNHDLQFDVLVSRWCSGQAAAFQAQHFPGAGTRGYL